MDVKSETTKQSNICEICEKDSKYDDKLEIVTTEYMDYICKDCIHVYYYLYENIINNQERRYKEFLVMLDKMMKKEEE